MIQKHLILTFYAPIDMQLVCSVHKVCGIGRQNQDPDPKLCASVNPRDASRGCIDGHRVNPNGKLLNHCLLRVNLHSTDYLIV